MMHGLWLGFDLCACGTSIVVYGEWVTLEDAVGEGGIRMRLLNKMPSNVEVV